MPDVSGIAVLDVAIGLIFVFFVLSIVCSAINELIASSLALRAKNLEQGIRSILDGSGRPNAVEEFFASPRIQALIEPGKTRLPSYIPPRAFALTVLDTFAPPEAGADEEQQRDLVARARRAVEKLRDTPLEDSPVGIALKDAVEAAGTNRDKLRVSLEHSFNEVMERAAGWYKRRVQLILVGLATFIVCVANVDTITIAQRLWKDDAVRAAVVQQATAQTAAAIRPASATPANRPPSPRRLRASTRSTRSAYLWAGPATPCPSAEVWSILGKVLGLILTIGAVSLGAPFWFDLLGKVSRLRSSGVQPNPAPGASADPPTGSAG